MNERIRQLLDGLSQHIYEKDEIIRLSLLAAIAGESVFLLGPPGVAKSLIARRLKYAFADGKSFEYLMSRFSTPDEVFGPVSIKKLKDEDKYERLTDRYLPGATVVFLDEIWKASPSIQNALLTVLNEKIYRNGEQDIPVSIKVILSASNELPQGGEGLDALWDRFLLRYIITEIKKNGNFLNMLTSTEDVYADNVAAAIKITPQELEQWQSEIQKIALPPEVLNTIQVIKQRLVEHDQKGGVPFQVYDRRWKKIVQLLKTSAFLNGRQAVDLMDCFLMVHCLWNTPDQLEPLQAIVSETIRKHGYSVALNLNGLKKEIQDLETDIQQETHVRVARTEDELYLIDHTYYEVEKLDSYLDGKFIKRSDYEKLKREEAISISVYDQNYKLTYKVKAQRSKEAHQIDVFHNAQLLPFQMRVQKIEKHEEIPRPPHPLVRKYWDESIQQLSDYIDKHLQSLDTDAPEALQGLDDHLFVPRHLSQIVRSNLNASINTLNSLRIRLEKLQHSYLRLEEPV
ncbi:MAG: AAA family ATPase [Bernardetiaceae bacterium]